MAMSNPAPAPETGYPTEWEQDVDLPSGVHLHIRPIRPTDAYALVAFHNTLSAETVYRRYFAPHPRLSEHEVDTYTHLDYRDRFALVAEVDGAMVGVARYCRLGGTDGAEVAFVVSDAHQHHGIGTVLARLLVEAARSRGIRRLVADVLCVNSEVQAMLRHAGFTAPQVPRDGVSELVLPLDGAPSGEQGTDTAARP